MMMTLMKCLSLLLLIVLAIVENGNSLGGNKNKGLQQKNFYDAMRDLLSFIDKTQKNNDQFNFDKYEVNMNTTVLRCEAFLSEIILSGFSSFDYTFHQEGQSTGTNTYKFSLSTSYTGLKFISNQYRLNMNILTMVPLYGDGRAGILLGDFTNVLNVTLGQTKEGYLNISELDIDFDIKTIEVSISGLLNTEAQSDLISSALSFILPTVLRDIKPWLLMIANPLASFALNDYLIQNKVTLDAIIKLIETYIGP